MGAPEVIRADWHFDDSTEYDPRRIEGIELSEEAKRKLRDIFDDSPDRHCAKVA